MSKPTFRQILSTSFSDNKKIQRAKTKKTSRMARRLQPRRRRSGRVLYRAKDRLQIHRLHALDERLAIASDIPESYVVGSGRHRTHMPRRQQLALLRTRRVLRSLVKSLYEVEAKLKQGRRPRADVFGVVYDDIDRSGRHGVDRQSVETHVRRALAHATHFEYDAAAREVALAAEQVHRAWRKIVRQREIFAHEAIRSAISRLREEIGDEFVKLPTLEALFRAINDRPVPIGKVFDRLLDVKSIAAACRIDHDFTQAQVLVDRLSRRLLLDDTDRKPQPLAAPLRAKTPSSGAVATNATRMLGRITVVGENRTGLLADTLRLINSNGGLSIIPRGSFLPSGKAEVDVIFDVQREDFERIDAIASEQLSGYDVNVSFMRIGHPGLITFAVEDADGATRDITAVLAEHDCDVVVSVPSLIHGSHDTGGKSVSYAFTALLARPPLLTMREVVRALEAVLKRRGGILVASEDCSEVLLGEHLDPSLIMWRASSVDLGSCLHSASTVLDTRRIGRLHVRESNRVRLQHDCLGMLENAGAESLCPVAMAGPDGDAVVDVLYRTDANVQEKVAQATKEVMDSSASLITYDHTAIMFTLSVKSHESVTSDVTETLQQHGCDLVYLTPGFRPYLDPKTRQVRIDYSLAGVLQPSSWTQVDELRKSLTAIALQRSGAAAVGVSHRR